MSVFPNILNGVGVGEQEEPVFGQDSLYRYWRRGQVRTESVIANFGDKAGVGICVRINARLPDYMETHRHTCT
jgi:hypothetical protein